MWGAEPEATSDSSNLSFSSGRACVWHGDQLMISISQLSTSIKLQLIHSIMNIIPLLSINTQHQCAAKHILYTCSAEQGTAAIQRAAARTQFRNLVWDCDVQMMMLHMDVRD
jgi:hypothetical protein